MPQEVEKFEDANWLLESHLLAEHGVEPGVGNKKSSKVEKVRRPEISPKMSTEKLVTSRRGGRCTSQPAT